jgi:hypothetical protein
LFWQVDTCRIRYVPKQYACINLPKQYTCTYLILHVSTSQNNIHIWFYMYQPAKTIYISDSTCINLPKQYTSESDMYIRLKHNQVGILCVTFCKKWILFGRLLCLSFERRETYCFSLIFSSPGLCHPSNSIHFLQNVTHKIPTWLCFSRIYISDSVCLNLPKQYACINLPK